MKTRPTNPFNITKAVDFSDQEINDLWVDIPGGAGFVGAVRPTSPMPMFILGGKGSGKTHLMRYFSYPLQMIRHGDDLIDGISHEGYLGIYLRCSGLNATRFKNKGQDPETWSAVFAYYMELWLSQLVLSTTLDLLGSACDWCEEKDGLLCSAVASLFDSTVEPQPQRLNAMLDQITRLQRDVDVAVNNSAITGHLDVEIKATSGRLIFGIPQIVSEHVPQLRHCLFLYLIDELENLSEPQQKYVNTLIREKEGPCSFKIGSRLYGIRTHSTYSADEENKEGSEFETVRLDSLLRGNEQYDEFAKRLIVKRLSEVHIVSGGRSSEGDMVKSLGFCFEEPGKDRFESEELAFVIDKYSGRERPYFRSLRQSLEQAYRAGKALGIDSEAEIDGVIAVLSCPEYPLLEKANTYLLYKDWYSNKNLVDAAAIIATECKAFLGESTTTRYARTLNHFKADLVAQLRRECDVKQRYVGIETLIHISWGLPRNLLIMLKHIFSWAMFNGETPFQDKPISRKAQETGVLEAAEWFYRDSRSVGPDGRLVQDSIDRLGTLFRSIRYSDKPAECSCVAFSVDLTEVNDEARRVIELAEKWSMLVDVGSQRDKNSARVDRKFQLNRMLAPRWDLPIYRRGVLALAPDEAEAVFDHRAAANFKEICRRRVARMTAPTFGKNTSAASSGLFSGL